MASHSQRRGSSSEPYGSGDASWHVGPPTTDEGDDQLQDEDFQVVSSSWQNYALLEGADESRLLHELFPPSPAADGAALSPIERSLSFEQGFVIAFKAIQRLRRLKVRQNIGPGKVVLGIGGPGGSGKSSLAHKIACDLEGCVVIPLENYVDTSKVASENYEKFESIDAALLTANLRDVIEGRDTEMPLFDFTRRERVAFRTLRAKDISVVILEGFFALHDDFSEYLDMKISIVGGVHYNLVKRVHRDLKKAGDAKVTEQDVLERVHSSYKEHVEPHLRKADLRIRNDFDYLASLKEPVYMLRIRGSPELDDSVAQHLMGAAGFAHASEKVMDVHVRPPSKGNAPLAGPGAGARAGHPDADRVRANGGRRAARAGARGGRVRAGAAVRLGAERQEVCRDDGREVELRSGHRGLAGGAPGH